MCGFGVDFNRGLDDIVGDSGPGNGPDKPKDPPPVIVRRAPLAPTPFLAPVAYRDRGAPPQPALRPQPYRGWQGAPPPPRWLPLVPWSALETTLRTVLAPPRRRKDVDAPRAVECLARAEPLDRVPRRARRTWLGNLVVVLDRSSHLVPFWQDQDLVLAALRRHLPHRTLQVVSYDDREGAFFRDGSVFGSPDDVARLAPDLLVLGDLGVTASDETANQTWVALGRSVGHGRARVLSPAPEERFGQALRETWRIADWAGRRRTARAPEDDAQELLQLIAPAIRIEPNLLRQVRVAALPHAGPEVEALVWNDPAMAIRWEDAGALVPRAAKDLRGAFAALNRDKRRKAIRAMRDWRGDLHPAIWFEEVLELDADSQSLLPPGAEHDIADAEAFFADMRATPMDGPDAHGVLRWADRMGDRAERLGKNPDARALIWRAKRRQDPTSTTDGSGELEPPERQSMVRIAGSDLVLAASGKGSVGGSLVGILPSVDWEVTIDGDAPGPPLTTFRDRLVDGGEGPEMVALPMGVLYMGSPADEEGRWVDEAPQHLVQITERFALAKYPVTFEEYDAFRKAAGREKPRDMGWGRGRRPAINVSWQDAQAYCAWLSEQTGATYRLPPRRSGNTPAGPERRHAIGGATTRTRHWRTVLGGRRPTRSTTTSRIRGACTTCMATCTSGAKINGKRATIARERRLLFSADIASRGASSVVALGSTTPGTAGPHIGSGVHPTPGTTSLASVPPEVRYRESQRTSKGMRSVPAFVPMWRARRSRPLSGAKARPPNGRATRFLRPSPPSAAG